MPPVGFEPTISAGERPQTYALDRAATGTGFRSVVLIEIKVGYKQMVFENVFDINVNKP